MKPHITDFLKFLESKENKRVPLVAKLLQPDKFSPITEEELNIDDLDLSESTIIYLPDNLTVEGDLDLSDTKIKSLPDNLTVTGTLYSIRNGVQSIPNNLKIGGNFYIWETPLGSTMTQEEIKQEIERKGGYLKGSINW